MTAWLPQLQRPLMHWGDTRAAQPWFAARDSDLHADLASCVLKPLQHPQELSQGRPSHLIVRLLPPHPPGPIGRRIFGSGACCALKFN